MRFGAGGRLKEAGGWTARAMRKRFVSDKVSVIIVNWNGDQFLERCLSVLMDQTFKPHEIILLDNASTDGSFEIARRFPVAFAEPHWLEERMRRHHKIRHSICSAASWSTRSTRQCWMVLVLAIPIIGSVWSGAWGIAHLC